MTTLVSSERRERMPIRIFRSAAGEERAIAFQPEWEPLLYPDSTSPPAPRREGVMPRLAPRWFELARSVVLSVCVSAFVTLVLTVRATGLAPDWAQAWLTTLKLSLLLGLPARFLIEPYVARIVELFIESPRP